MRHEARTSERARPRAARAAMSLAGMAMTMTVAIAMVGVGALCGATALAGSAGEEGPDAVAATTTATKGPAHKVLVVAHIDDAEARGMLERIATAEFQRKGIEAIAGSEVLSDADLESAEALQARAESLGVDGLLGFFVLEIDDGETPRTHSDLYVGVPYHHGPYYWYTGRMLTFESSGPKMPKIKFGANFYIGPDGDPVWEKTYADIWREEHRERITKEIAYDSVRLITRAKLAAGR